MDQLYQIIILKVKVGKQYLTEVDSTRDHLDHPDSTVVLDFFFVDRKVPLDLRVVEAQCAVLEGRLWLLRASTCREQVS